MTETERVPNLLTVNEFCERHSWARKGGLRHALHLRDVNGFAACTIRFGRKILLDEAKVFAWLKEHGANLSGSAEVRRG